MLDEALPVAQVVAHELLELGANQRGRSYTQNWYTKWAAHRQPDKQQGES